MAAKSRYDRTRLPKREVEKQSDRLVQVASLVALPICAGVNVVADINQVKAPLDWYVFVILLAIAGGKEVTNAVFERIFGGKR